jgi:hypothetical protein
VRSGGIENTTAMSGTTSGTTTAAPAAANGGGAAAGMGQAGLGSRLLLGCASVQGFRTPGWRSPTVLLPLRCLQGPLSQQQPRCAGRVQGAGCAHPQEP